LMISIVSNSQTFTKATSEQVHTPLGRRGTARNT
jgi:hypothetical protein